MTNLTQHTPDGPLSIEAENLNRLRLPLDERATPAAMNAMLELALADDRDCETVLFMQAQTLNALFHRMIEKGIGWQDPRGKSYPEHVNSDHVQLAITAQKQCRATIDALSKVRTRKAFSPLPPAKNDERNE